MNKTIVIAGKTIPMRLMDRHELKGVLIGALLMYSFYDSTYLGVPFVLLESKAETHLTPAQCKTLTTKLSSVLGKPCVLKFDQLASYERNRYIEQGVYFVVSGKYAFLPFLILNARDSAPINKQRLQPAAQYLLLYHLQRKSLEGCTLSDMEKLLPYNYLAISRAVRQLEATYLAHVSVTGNGTKHIHFEIQGKQLWKKAEPLMQNPIKSVWYADREVAHGVVGGINALSRYSNLNPERMQTKVLHEPEFRKAQETGTLPELNKLDGDTRIEVWKYPPVIAKEDVFVDPLSLVLTLREDPDPRVEIEIERVVDSLQSPQNEVLST